MVERGGTATQAGITFQNGVAALALADLLDLDDRLSRDRLIEVRVEAPEDVDDIVLRFADQRQEFLTVKLSLSRASGVWTSVFQSLAAQFGSRSFGPTDKLVIVVSERSTDSNALAETCQRAVGAVDDAEWRSSLTHTHTTLVGSIEATLPPEVVSFELLRRIEVRHQSEDQMLADFGRRRLANARSAAPSLFAVLRDLVAQTASRRGLFQPGPLRRRLRLEHGIRLEEPAEWGLETYRATVRRLARLEIPGKAVATPVDDVFVWPRTRHFDMGRPTGFEDETDLRHDRIEDAGPDLQIFPSEAFKHVVVVAGPGHGKTALVTALTAALCSDVLTPVVVSLAALASANEPVISYLGGFLSTEMSVSANWERLAEQGLLVLLFDGLDEVPSQSRPKLMKRIATFSARFPDVPWLLTVRDVAVVTGLPEAAIVELLPLNDQDIERFADKMKTCADQLPGWQVVNRLHLYPDLERLARIPLFLAMLLASSDLSASTALTRAGLIESYLKTMFDRPDPNESPGPAVSSGELRTIAQRLAFELLEQQQVGATGQDVRRIIAPSAAGRTDEVLTRLTRNGVLKAQAHGRLQFPYPIVQEYLAACELVDAHGDTIGSRSEDAIQRPWAQVLQFALELHLEPEPIIRAMLERPDDAFSTGLRLVGRCIANGARVTPALRLEVGDRLVAFWISAPSRARERVGRLLADGFCSPLSPALRAALRRRSLIQDGAGDIVSQLNDLQLTLEVLSALIESDQSIRIYHSLKPALQSAGDAAIDLIARSLDPDVRTADEIDHIASLFSNFTPASVSRERLLRIARNARLPDQTRMRAYELAGSPLEDDGVHLARAGLRHADWDRHYEASDLVELHPEPASFICELFKDDEIPITRRRDLAAKFARMFPDVDQRAALVKRVQADIGVPKAIKVALSLFQARYGDRAAFETLIEGIETNDISDARTTIALFGHYREAALAERAATLARIRGKTADEVVELAAAATTGLLYVFEMDFGFGGILRSAPPHPGLNAWRDLVDDWCVRKDLSPIQSLRLMTISGELGAADAYVRLESALAAIDDFDADDWGAMDNMGHNLSSALYQLQRSRPALSSELIEKCLASTRYNIAARGVEALTTMNSVQALERLLEISSGHQQSMLRDTAANAVELLAAKLGRTVTKHGDRYALLTT